MTTDFTALLGIEHPIVQAPVGGISNPELAAAVSNAGALGMLAMTWQPLDAIARLLNETRALTKKPCGVNLVLEWDQHERVARCLDVEQPPAVVSLFWGDPSPYVPAIHAARALAAHTVGSADEARRAVDSGVDIIVAQGWEAGGHVWGQVSTLALVPAVVDAVGGQAPVLAAGGIVDGRGMAAAIALGASGVWMGTRFLAAAEASIHRRYCERLLAANETDTVHTTLFDVGWPNAPHRVLIDKTFNAWRKAGSPPPGKRAGEGEIVAWYDDGEPIARYADNAPTSAVARGDVDAMAMYAGQGVAGVTRVQPAAEIVREVAAGADAVIRGLARRRSQEPT